MKNILLIALSCAILASCATTPARDAASVSPMGIVAVESNQTINWYGEDQDMNSSLLKIVGKEVAKESKNDTLTAIFGDEITLVTNSEKILRDSLSKKGIVLVESKKIFTAKSYTDAKEPLLIGLTDEVTPVGYRFVSYSDKKMVKALAAEAGIANQLFVKFLFNKDMDVGIKKTGTCRAVVTITAIVVDAEGKVIFQKSFLGKSEKTIPIIGGIYDPRAMGALFPSATAAACNLFADKFVK